MTPSLLENGFFYLNLSVFKRWDRLVHTYHIMHLQTHIERISELCEVWVPAVPSGDAARVGHLHRRVDSYRVHEDRPVMVHGLKDTSTVLVRRRREEERGGLRWL